LKQAGRPTRGSNPRGRTSLRRFRGFGRQASRTRRRLPAEALAKAGEY